MKRFRHSAYVNGDIAKIGDKSMLHCFFLVVTWFWNWLNVFWCKLEHFDCVTRGTQHNNRFML